MFHGAHLAAAFGVAFAIAAVIGLAAVLIRDGRAARKAQR